MTDVSKAIYSGDWELYPKDGKVTIQDFEHCKIVLTEAEVLEEYSIEYMYEDQLPDGIPDAVYSAMYACSEVDFVRLFPFVTINGQKRFLIELPEVEE